MKFINPANIVAELGLKTGDVVADLGCGAGYYATAAAKKVGSDGHVYSIDVQESKLAATQSLARQLGLKNISVVKADLDKPMLDMEEGRADAVIMASILHEVTSRESLLRNAYRLLKTGGKLLAVEWKKESTPLGPPVESRISETELAEQVSKMGLKKIKEISADPYHYAVVFSK